MNKHTISTLGSIRIALTSIIHWQSTAAERARIPHPQPLGDAVLVELVGARARHHAQLFPVLELLQADATAAGTAAVVSTSGDKLVLLELASHRRCGRGEDCTAEAAVASLSERRYGCY